MQACPKCGSVGRRQAYPTGTEPPQEWLCGSYIEPRGDVIIKKGEFMQSDKCRIASLADEVEACHKAWTDLRHCLKDLISDSHGGLFDTPTEAALCALEVMDSLMTIETENTPHAP